MEDMGGIHIRMGDAVRYEGQQLPAGWDFNGRVTGLSGLDPENRTATVQFTSNAGHIQAVPVSLLTLDPTQARKHHSGDSCK